MAAINESREWADDIYLIARQDKVLGGAGGIANIQATQLAARTLFLRDRTDELNTRAMRVVGSFENGATVTSRNQLVQFGQDNGLYCWKGYYPEGVKVVPAGSTPATTGGTGSQGWDAYDNDILRNEIAPYIKAIGYFMHEEGADVTADLQAFIYSHYRTVIPRQSYRTLIKSNVVIPSSRELVIHNDVEQITDEVDTWSVNHVASKYPMFRIPPGATDTIIRGKGWLWAVYEGVLAEADETSEGVITRPRIEVNVAGKLKDASLNNYSRFGGITAYKAIDIDVTGSRVFHCGIRPIWDAVNLRRVGGGANGIGFYSCRGMKGHRVWTYRCGGNGIFTNASFSPNFQLCQNISNGLSGIQHGPGGNADQGQICNNNNSLNVADGIDIRWTGTGVASVKLQLNGNYHYRNGYFDEDMTKPTQDGSGLATIAYVSGVDMNGNTSIESAGSGLYLQGCASVKGTGNTASVYTTKEGIYLGGGTVASAIRSAWELDNPVGTVRLFAKNVNPNQRWPWSEWVYTGENKALRVGKADGSDVGQTGGSDTVTLQQANLPAVQIDVTGETSEQEEKTLTTTKNGKHNHGGVAGKDDPWEIGGDVRQLFNPKELGVTDDAGEHDHEVTVPAHKHTTSGKTASLGEGKSFSVVEAHTLLMCWSRVA